MNYTSNAQLLCGAEPAPPKNHLRASRVEKAAVKNPSEHPGHLDSCKATGTAGHLRTQTALCNAQKAFTHRRGRPREAENATVGQDKQNSALYLSRATVTLSEVSQQQTVTWVLRELTFNSPTTVYVSRLILFGRSG